MAIAIPVIAAELSLAFAFFVGTLGFPVIDEVNLGVECVLEGDMLPGMLVLLLIVGGKKKL